MSAGIKASLTAKTASRQHELCGKPSREISVNNHVCQRQLRGFNSDAKINASRP
jgi:hypothetical protein